MNTIRNRTGSVFDIDRKGSAAGHRDLLIKFIESGTYALPLKPHIQSILTDNKASFRSACEDRCRTCEILIHLSIRPVAMAARSQPDIVHAHIGVFMGIQRLVYASKSLRGSPLVRPLNTMGKKAAGLYFDVFLGRYRTEGMTFEIPKEHTDLAMRGKFTADTYELPERVLAKRYLPPTAAVLELGGCIGVVACVINHVLQQPRCHVVVEGNPSIIPVLKRNRDLNGCAFQIVHGVVTQSPQPRMSVGLVMDSNQLANTGVEVPALSIEYLESTHAMRFDALVMDIEGAEYNVLRENANRLPSLNTAIIEFHPWLIGEARTAQLYRLMSEAGLRKVDEMLSTQVWLRA